MAAYAPQVAMDATAALAAGETAFEHFTVTLVQNTMDALVSSAVSQMKSYADMVSTLERGLAAFKTEANPPDGSAILAWIKLYLPQVGGYLTAPTTTGAPFTIANIPTTSPPAWNADSADALSKLFQEVDRIGGATFALNNGFSTTSSSTPPPANPPLAVDTSLTTQAIKADQFYLTSSTTPPAPPPGLLPANAKALSATATTPAATILDAINAVLNNSAEQSFNQLYALVKAGLYRVVVTDGHILTRGTFALRANDSAQDNSSSIGVSNFQIAGSARYAGRRLGASIAASYSQLNIRVATSSSSSSTSITENVMGEVLVNFKGDYFPALTVQPTS
ncbi:MAG TPA: hypothetical protein VIM02_14625 [Rhizomicrobium sp.]|jgi:hypothetical protein